MKVLKVAILGFGNAGKAFAKLLDEKKEEIENKYNTRILVVAITTKTKGSVINEAGIDLHEVIESFNSLGSFLPSLPFYSTTTSFDIVNTVDYDVLIELTPLVIFSGQPAIDHIKGAFIRKKHAITANKGPIAWAFKDLKDLADKNGCLFYYETTVMDGTPLFNLVEETLKFCKVTKIRGILNSTTNFILEELASGRDYDEVVLEGRSRGFIEADPSIDIKGWDAAAKTAALINVLMDAGITPNDVERKGIEDIRKEDIEKAELKGNTIKLICESEIKGDKITGTVKPIEISKSTLFANINGTSSIITITTDLMGKISIVEHDPEIEQTAYGIFSDLLRVICNHK